MRIKMVTWSKKAIPLVLIMGMNFTFLYNVNKNFASHMTNVISDLPTSETIDNANPSYNNKWTDVEPAFKDISMKRIWKGDASKNDIPIHKQIYISLIIGGACKGKDLNAFLKYLNNYEKKDTNLFIQSITIVSSSNTCSTSNLKRERYNVTNLDTQINDPDLNYMKWLASYSTQNKVLIENHYIFFLTMRSIKEDTKREVIDVLKSATENGFGCVQKPLSEHSYYHDFLTLRSFSSNNVKQPKHYSNLWTWYDELQLSFNNKDIVPVCYGSSFAIPSQQLASSKYDFSNIYKLIEEDSDGKHNPSELAEFLERSWANIFSYTLNENQLNLLHDYTTKTYDKQCCYTGALIHEINKSQLDLFHGDTLHHEEIDYSTLQLSLVISHCHENMQWMRNAFKGLKISNVTIYSKCKGHLTGHFFSPQAKVIKPPNVGRCDHSYAHFMGKYDNEKNKKEISSNENHYILFMKASRFIHQIGMSYRDIKDMIRIAHTHGFGCEMKHNSNSYYHNTTLFQEFRLTKHRGNDIASPYTNMKQWWNELDITLPKPITPVCYGGNFVVKASQIFGKRDIWNKIEKNLMRGECPTKSRMYVIMILFLNFLNR